MKAAWIAASIFLLVLIVYSGGTVACFDGGGDDDDSDDDSEDDWNDEESCWENPRKCGDWDDWDDDTWDDDTWDDDTWNDDDDTVPNDGFPPVLSNGLWDPDPIGSDNISTLFWDVCDEGDNLSGGQIFLWQAGTTSPFLSGDVFWDDFTEGAPSAPDCANPVNVGIGVDFSGAPSGTYAADLEATDGSGNLSNTLIDLEVTMP